MSTLPVALLTREWPPHVYGGAGVHVVKLVEALRRDGVGVEVHPTQEDFPDGARAIWRTLGADARLGAAVGDVRLVHSHTWYTGLAGHLIALERDVAHVVTAHSLEPLRPWKAEQLGGGYRVSSWLERTSMLAADAVIAVSAAMREDVLTTYPIEPERVHVIGNGVDPREFFPDTDSAWLTEAGLDLDRPIVTFVGRITRQKGLEVLLAAAERLAEGVQLVLAAGSPDTPEIERRVTTTIEALRATRPGVHWWPAMLPRERVRQLLTASSVFCCPSLYEPLGIVNLEAMACGTAVVASRVGGIVEVVDESSGVLVDPDDPDALAEALNGLTGDRPRAERLGAAGLRRAREDFSWGAIARRTAALYDSLT